MPVWAGCDDPKAFAKLKAADEAGCCAPKAFAKLKAPLEAAAALEAAPKAPAKLKAALEAGLVVAPNGDGWLAPNSDPVAPPPKRDAEDAGAAEEVAPNSDGVLVEPKMLAPPAAPEATPNKDPVAAAELAPKIDAEDAGGGKANCGLVELNMTACRACAAGYRPLGRTDIPCECWDARCRTDGKVERAESGGGKGPRTLFGTHLILYHHCYWTIVLGATVDVIAAADATRDAWQLVDVGRSPGSRPRSSFAFGERLPRSSGPEASSNLVSQDMS